jgi:hypothetical protein
MSVRTGYKFPYEDDYICFSEGLQHNYIQIDVIDRIWLDNPPRNCKFTEEENLKLPNRRKFSVEQN